ncbi:MAG: hypothetical protein B7Z77_08865 [Acidocella sp. 20-58-15]|nr:MAG: hypothetical protein B7Z77_08865 [Acidocella sp. 20-58-15]
MDVGPQFDDRLARSTALRREGVPVAFMHVPKTAGTSLTHAISQIAPGGCHVRGFDRSSFGGFESFDDIPASMRRLIYLHEKALPADAVTICGHFSYNTLRSQYPAAELVTVLREPAARLLSHWTYWRGLTWWELRRWGPVWAERLKLAALPLAEFLSHPEIACQTDNIVTRMLVWPEQAVPAAGFIDPHDDARLLHLALARLRRFGYVDVVERGEAMMADFSTWVGAPLALPRLNETPLLPRRMRTGYQGTLTPRALALLQQRSRLDVCLWRQVAGRYRWDTPIDLLQEAARLRAVARCALLLAG